jgi:hypothetical protein
MNHKPTEAQKADALMTFGISGFVETPAEISGIWSNITADAETLDDILLPVKAWLASQAEAGDVVLIQGDFGAVYHMVNYAFVKRLVPVYATTSREVVEVLKEDGSIEITRIFRHRMFRRYSA